MDSLLGDDIVIGSYSAGVVAPAVFHYANQKLQPVLSEIDPSYVLHHDTYYYVSSERTHGTITTLDADFKVLSKVKTLGDGPCHLSIDNTGKFLAATNYDSGSAIIYRLQNHIPSSVHSLISHEGSSNHPIRQTTSHPHTTVWSQDNSILFLADLGTDWVYYYAFTPQSVKWEKEKSIKFEGSGPRTQSRGRPGSKLIYLSCQLDNTIRVLSYKGPGLQQLAVYKVSTNPKNFPSEIKYFQDQVYVALRGDDKISIFNVKGQKLEEQRSFKVEAQPRFFAISKGGQTVFVTAQNANLVQKFLVTPEKILLVSQTKVRTPSCVVIL